MLREEFAECESLIPAEMHILTCPPVFVEILPPVLHELLLVADGDLRVLPDHFEGSGIDILFHHS